MLSLSISAKVCYGTFAGGERSLWTRLMNASPYAVVRCVGFSDDRRRGSACVIFSASVKALILNDLNACRIRVLLSGFCLQSLLTCCFRCLRLPLHT